ncbi:hypothetical protein [Spiroplasma endosymbiont of Polydrusus cervinus]|uniref:hypothetical protein n=1 Tax=Spiroplasma endosymbiont of Polydrusus cervinus TaxID=3066287 RepID=UPI0030CF58F5
MLKIAWNINNKKQCQTTTQLQATYHQTLLRILQKEVQYSNSGKVIIPGSVLIPQKK